MGRISDEDVARVRDATDIASLVSETVVLKPKGRLLWGLCPFHGEKTPSFKVDPATQLWHCFGCGLGGDAFGFVMRVDNVDFPDAVRLLADRGGIELREEEAGGVPKGRKERLYAAVETATEYYHRVLVGSRGAGPKAAREYLARRGFGSGVAKQWRLGFAPGRGALVGHLTSKGFTVEEMVEANLVWPPDAGWAKDRFVERIMFPIRDLQGRAIAFGGRVLDSGEPKYLNTNDTPIFRKSANLYGIDRSKGAITSTGTGVVVEGYTDVIALHEAGVTNAVATLGTALTMQHVKLLGRFAKQVVYLFDGDEAGMRAADRAVEFVDAGVTPEAGASRVELDVAVIPDNLDPADLVSKKGADALRAVIDTAQPLLRFAIDRRLARWDLDRPEERARALKDAAQVLAPVKDSLLADDYANYIADRLFADFTTVKRSIADARTAPVTDREERVQPTPTSVTPVTPQMRAECEMLGLMVRVGRLRSRARELLADGLLADESYREIARAISEQGPAATASDVAKVIEQRVPGSAEAMSGATLVPEGDEEADALAADLTRRLKEFAFERRIAAGRAKLKQAGSTMSPPEYDEVFREVSSLQRELDSLRRSGSEAT